MQATPTQPRIYEFCFLNLDYTLVQVVVTHDEVTIRATADLFTPERKLCFIRELASEGFIPDDYHWFPLAGVESYSRGVRWIVDSSWLKLDEALEARTGRWMRRYIAPMTLVWLLMIFVFNHDPGYVSTARSAHRTFPAVTGRARP